MNYLNITYEQLLVDFKKRLESDPRFKNIGSSTIYGMFQEMLLATADMTNYYLQRTAEEAYIDSARLDSSVIKLGKNLGYNPRRAVPAICDLIIKLHGPLPANLEAGAVVVFNQYLTDLSFNGMKFILDASYTYTFTEEDINAGKNSDWEKNLRFSVPASDTRYIPLIGASYYNDSRAAEIKCFQAERKTVIIEGSKNLNKIGKPNQFYDIDDITFSNWYSRRDPFAYYMGNYTPTKSWTQVGIGPSEDEAFKEENLFDIEDQSIFLNDRLLKLKEAPQIPLKICQMETNSDKTVRLSFTPETTMCDIGIHKKVGKTTTQSKNQKRNINKVILQDQDEQRNTATFINNGLNTDNDNIYVRYLSTSGKAGNQTGTKSAIMTHNNKFYVSSRGNIIDVSNNIQFVINSDIYGGDDFETQRSIKINAPAYFSSRNKLVTTDDFTSHFRALTSPINVQNALVFGEQEFNDMYNTQHTLFQNNIFYCLFGHMYLKNSGDWYMKNILTDQNDNNEPLTVYGDDYINHISDYLFALVSYEAYIKKLYNKNPTEQWLKNIQLINNNAKHKTEINSILLSLPPAVQYFDLVGNVTVKKETDLQAYQTEMKNKVYEYLDNKAYTSREIYKSDIIGLYYNNENTVSVDLDIKVSNIVKSDTFNYKYTSNDPSDYEFLLNKNLESYINNANNISSFDTPFNVIKVLKHDNFNKELYAKSLNKKRVMIKYDTQHCYDAKNIQTENHILITRCECYEDDNYVYLALSDINDLGAKLYTNTSCKIDNITGHVNGVSSIELYIPTTDDYFSTSKFSPSKSDTYKLTGDDVKGIENDLNKWLSNLTTSITANRAIPLPYSVYSNSTTTREETILRLGTYTDNNYAESLTEAAFWRYFVKEIIIDKYYGKSNKHAIITESSLYDSEEWKAVRALIADIYPLVKAGICDSILDDNNNITNFSTPMEIAVIQNLIDIKCEK